MVGCATLRKASASLHPPYKTPSPPHAGGPYPMADVNRESENRCTAMPLVRIDCGRITDWDSFHTTFADVFGFPSYYGHNLNAWIDCMSYLDEPGAGMTTITVPPGGVVTIQLDGVDEYAVRCPEQYDALVECAAFVNWRRSSRGEPALLALAFWKSR